MSPSPYVNGATTGRVCGSDTTSAPPRHKSRTKGARRVHRRACYRTTEHRIETDGPADCDGCRFSDSAGVCCDGHDHIEVAVYYVLSEALTNAAKHANDHGTCPGLKSERPALRLDRRRRRRRRRARLRVGPRRRARPQRSAPRIVQSEQLGRRRHGGRGRAAGGTGRVATRLGGSGPASRHGGVAPAVDRRARGRRPGRSSPRARRAQLSRRSRAGRLERRRPRR